MELVPAQRGLLDGYLDGFLPLIGDRRTAVTFRATVQGIIGSESLVCAQIAAASPILATSGTHGEQRVRRMAKGESTKRSDLGAGDIVGKLQARGAEVLRDESEVWAIVDPSELRKPYAREMPDLMRVRKLASEGEGTVPGYRTLNVLGVGRGDKRGVLYHRLFTSEEEEFLSESKETQDALDSVGKALKDKAKDKAGRVTYICDTQFDDVAVWGAIWEQDNHLVVRLKHQERLVEAKEVGEAPEAAKAAAKPAEGERLPDSSEPILESIAELKTRAREVARVRTEMLVRKRKQRLKKRQPVNAVVSALPIRVQYQVDQRTRPDGERRAKDVYLVVVRLENVELEPWLLLTDHPVTNEREGLRVFRMYRERWAVEDCFRFTREVLGWEDVQLMDLEGIRTLLALGWVAAGFLHELGVSLDWPEVRLIARLGEWNQREDRPPGKTILTRGLQQLLNSLVVEAVLQDEIDRYGQLPPRIAAMLGRPSKPEPQL